jgi:hypothetical protein
LLKTQILARFLGSVPERGPSSFREAFIAAGTGSASASCAGAGEAVQVIASALRLSRRVEKCIVTLGYDLLRVLGGGFYDVVEAVYYIRGADQLSSASSSD